MWQVEIILDNTDLGKCQVFITWFRFFQINIFLKDYREFRRVNVLLKLKNDKRSDLLLWEDLEGAGGEGGGRGDRDGEDM